MDSLREMRHASCPKCGWHDLRVQKRLDRVDRLNRNPLRLLLRFFGVPLYHCAHCRLQFYDIRRLRREEERNAAANRIVESESKF